MLDLALVASCLLLALALRTEPLRRMRPLTLPLVLTALAALAHLLVTRVRLDDSVLRVTEAVLVLALAFLIVRGCLMVIFDWVLIHRMGITPPRLMREVLALVVYVVLALVILRSMNVEITGLVATSAVVTVVVGLALQQTLGNLLAGLALAWEQRLGIGTWVEMNGEVGLVEETGWRSLVARNRLGERVLVPNSDVAAARVTILGRGERPVAVAVRLGVAYGEPPDAVKAVLAEVARDIPGVLSEPSPSILTVEFADSAVVYECRLWTMTPWTRENLTDAMLTRAHAALAREGMEIPFPQRTLHRARRPEPRDTAQRRRRALAACALFEELPPEALDDLAEGSTLRRFAPDEAVVHKGDVSTALYVVSSGEAIVERKRGREIARLAPGDIFGEMAFLTGTERTATVRAAAVPLEVVKIEQDGLRRLLADRSDLADELAEKMAARQLEGEALRDETGALISPAGLVAQFRDRLLRLVGLGSE
jgi:small-conductance mechanosensitive channel/CRP-like cAMP-binding protein